MSAYWRNEEKIPMSQTQVSIPSVNGLSYTATAGQGGRRVDFEIPPSVKFMDGKNSYLNLDIKLGIGAIPTRLQLDPFIGGQSLIKNIRIYANSGGRPLLEEITDYNAKVQLEYSYNQDESIRKMRALKEGCLVDAPHNRGTLGTSSSNLIDLDTNPYYPTIAAPAADFDNDSFVTAKLSLPLHTGIFADSNKIFPVMLVDGLHIEIDLEDPARCIKQLDSVNRHRRMQQNPIINGMGAADAGAVVGATEYTEIFLAKDNNMLSVARCPFVVGENIAICSKTDPTIQPNLTTGGAAVNPANLLITAIAVDGGYVKLTVTSFRNSLVAAEGGTGTAITTNNFIVYSTAMDTHRKTVNAAGATISPAVILATDLYDATMTVSNLELVVQQVSLDSRYESGMVSKMREGGAIELDILSATNYKHSVLSSNRNATINLPLSNKRAKSIFAIPTDAKVYNTAELIGGLGVTYDEERLTMDGRLHSVRSGQVGIIDNLTEYQWLLDDKLVPSRPVKVGKINGGKSISAQPLIELEKACNQAKIVPRSFVDYNRNFVIARAYALNDGVMDLNNKTNQLQLLYNQRTAAGVDEPPAHDKLFMAFVYHLRRIIIKGDSVSVEL